MSLRISQGPKLQKRSKNPQNAELLEFSAAIVARQCFFQKDKLHNFFLQKTNRTAAFEDVFGAARIYIDLIFGEIISGLKYTIDRYQAILKIAYSITLIIIFARWEGDQQPSQCELGQQGQHAPHPSGQGDSIVACSMQYYVAKNNACVVHSPQAKVMW